MADSNFISSLAGSLSAESRVLSDERSADWKDSMNRWSHYGLKMPSAIVRPKTEADVVTAVQKLVSASIPFVPASGGHSPFSYIGKEGVVIDLSQFTGVEVNETKDLATVRGGTLMKELQTSLHAHGRFAAVGSGNTVGVIPYYIGGGISAYTPLYGYGSENIVAAKIVTAKGDLVKVSERENADLFWGLRGAGQFFGLVVELTIKISPYSLMGNDQGQRMLGTYIFTLDKLDAVSAAMVPIMESEECASAGHFSIALAPPDFQHQVLLVAPQVFASAEDAEKLLKPLADLGPIMQTFVPSTFEKHSDHFDYLCAKGSFKRFTQIGMTGFSKDNFAELINLHSELVKGCPDAAMSAFSVEWHTPYKGSREVVSFGHAQVDYWMNILSWYQDPKSHDFVDSVGKKAQAISRKGDDEDAFVTYTNTSRDDPLPWRYKGEERINRLRALKKEWDPTGVFTKTFL
ncbi:hypothetical protein PFICI_05743 [Pestalotiopsis fici W106-1]|uniref:FAD-binding PCMH-type domain-containing protein n=1 Tax=Pestalotiopsis fici (strain W106-1 / CGMCC3.15140) TaxID=1229662 RepID=W3XEN9_PESFW|nr:uncharacterized protein PFICI_05743 [Pestalotiopsis fici W106-1]ETS83867.1 hypothetical protein PFICI_05743 [Pestalotiopsis fici W106-1]